MIRNECRSAAARGALCRGAGRVEYARIAASSRTALGRIVFMPRSVMETLEELKGFEAKAGQGASCGPLGPPHQPTCGAQLLLVLLSLATLHAQTRLVVTVIDRRTGEPITNLKASNFSVTDDRTPRQVQSADYGRTTVDVMLLFDTSLVGEMVYPLGEAFIN